MWDVGFHVFKTQKFVLHLNFQLFSSCWHVRPCWVHTSIARRFIRVEWNIQIKNIIYKKFWKSITKSYILNIKLRPLVTEYAFAHLFNPYAYFGHLWSYFDIKNLWLVILYILSTKGVSTWVLFPKQQVVILKLQQQKIYI
jgi:hypothetical protein